MATHLPVRHDSRMDSAMSDVLAQRVRVEVEMSFETKLTGREVESPRPWRIFLTIMRGVGMMLGGDLDICRLVIVSTITHSRRGAEGRLCATNNMSPSSISIYTSFRIS